MLTTVPFHIVSETLTSVDALAVAVKVARHAIKATHSRRANGEAVGRSRAHVAARAAKRKKGTSAGPGEASGNECLQPHPQLLVSELVALKQFPLQRK